MKGMILTPAAEADRRRFDAEQGGCSCFQNAPCGHCTHPGNPVNQAEDEDCWTAPPRAHQVAQQFWDMNSDEQAEFYAELHRISGGHLCMQTAFMVGTIAKRHADGDADAARGFRTLHSHAEPYLEVYVHELARPARCGVTA